MNVEMYDTSLVLLINAQFTTKFQGMNVILKLSNGHITCVDKSSKSFKVFRKIFPIKLERVVCGVSPGTRASIFYLAPKKTLLHTTNNSHMGIHQIEFEFSTASASKELTTYMNFILSCGRQKQILEKRAVILIESGDKMHELVQKYIKPVLAVALKPLDISVVNFQQPASITNALASLDIQNVNFIACIGKHDFSLLEKVLSATSYSEESICDVSDAAVWDPVVRVSPLIIPAQTCRRQECRFSKHLYEATKSCGYGMSLSRGKDFTFIRTTEFYQKTYVLKMYNFVYK